jgi:hypothetical protein
LKNSGDARVVYGVSIVGKSKLLKIWCACETIKGVITGKEQWGELKE